jgi:hypothetical protein
MAKRRKKQRTKKTQYTRQRDRIMRYNRTLRKKGLEVGIYFPTELELRKSGVKGSELSALTKELKQYTSKVLQQLATPIAQPEQEPTNTPGFIPPENISEDESFFDKVVISGFKQHVRQFNERASNLLLSWLDRILATNDAHDVATMLNDGAEAGLIVSYQIVYSQDKLTQYMSEMLNYLPEAGSLFKAEMMDAMEQEEDFSSPL